MVLDMARAHAGERSPVKEGLVFIGAAFVALQLWYNFQLTMGGGDGAYSSDDDGPFIESYDVCEKSPIVVHLLFPATLHDVWCMFCGKFF